MGAFDSFIRIVDYALQGALAVLVVWYGLDGLKSFDTWLGAKWELVKMHKTELSSTMPGTAFFLIAVAGCYSAGMILNSVAYDLLQPAHEHIIHGSLNSRQIDTLATWDVTLLAFRRHVDETERPARVKSLCAEVSWLNKSREASESALGPLVKQLRIYRGVAMCSVAFMAVSICKTIIILLFSRRRRSRWWRPVAYAAVGYVICLGCIRQWQDTEAQYHTLVRFGLQSSSPTQWADCLGDEK